ncbi:sugar ABC transporter permease [Faecalicatena orotica]|uniref:Raffinose/stachyose/melibiose transport system permease protein n=1 Tax=Faecalicatena orotica TaxID=1544 RepID=A0A2Y9BKH6_9FIRM|nr:sugar ABC transporter permease [Faecalicatena orotica]PWJ22900.1 raffinose/stachyose/melibiose transport system permease protein [Faecalicatena orotica]SSA58035.1 raffinose/stachyose/melibiose transport system permease protein [Faecalicatena orotica]
MKKNKAKKSSKMNGLPWILPAFIFVVGIIYYSIFYTFDLSTLNWNGLDPIQTKVGISNYTKVFSDWVFWKAITNTIVYFIVTFLVQNFLGFIFAAILHTKVKLATLHKCLIFIPTILAPATMAPVFRLLFSPQGLLQDIFNVFHLGITVDWLSKSNSALIILMMIAVWQFTGMSFILYYAAMSQIDKEMLEASHLDGAGNIRTLFNMVLPNCKGTIISLAMLGIIGALKTFDIPYLVTTGGPNHATEFLGTYIYRQGIRQSHLGYAAAISVVLLVLAICGALLINRMNKGEES